MKILAIILIILGLIGILINAPMYFQLKKLKKELRKEINEDLDEINSTMSPFTEHHGSLLIFAIAMLAIGLFLIIR